MTLTFAYTYTCTYTRTHTYFKTSPGFAAQGLQQYCLATNLAVWTSRKAKY